MSSSMRNFARWVLIWAERLYLKAHGWDRLGSGVAGEEELYLAPSDYEFKRHPDYHRRHAVNAQHARYAEQHRAHREARERRLVETRALAAGDVPPLEAVR